MLKNKQKYAFIFLKILGFLAVLYIFLLSIQLMGSSMKMFGKDFADGLISTTSNPFVGLFIGILATSVIQSSSTTTSIVVGLAASGLLPIGNAIPIIMGANIGTSVTNTIVSLGHVTRKNEFKRAFAGAIVHDFFNLLAVLVLLPLELIFHPIEILATSLTNIFVGAKGLTFVSPIKVLLEPGLTFFTQTINSPVVLLISSFILLFISLSLLVRLMKSLIIDRIEVFIDAYLFKNISTAFSLGMVFTALVQSSSITTALVIPMVGARMLSVKKIYPYTLGANIGTTITAILAALVTTAPIAITVAFSHLLFNIVGIAVVSSIFGYLPVRLAKKFASVCADQKKLALGYIIITFFVVPLSLIFLNKII